MEKIEFKKYVHKFQSVYYVLEVQFNIRPNGKKFETDVVLNKGLGVLKNPHSKKKNNRNKLFIWIQKFNIP